MHIYIFIPPYEYLASFLGLSHVLLYINFNYLNITPRGVFLLFLMMPLIGARPEFNLTRTLFYFRTFIVFIQ